MDWADLGPQTGILLWARPGPEGRTGPGPAWPRTKWAGGINFPPPLHAERYSFCMQRRKKINTRIGGKKSYLARGGGGFLRFWWCCDGGWWRRLAHGQRLQAALRLFLTVWFVFSVPPLSLRSLGLLFFLLFSGWSFLSSRSSSLFFSLFLLSPSFYLFPLSPLFFFVFSFFSSVHFSPSVLFSPPLLLCWLLFIEPSEWLFAVEHGEQPAGRPLGATAKARPPSPVFWQVRGGWSAIVSGRWAPGERVAGKKFKLKQPFFLLPRCMFGGKKKDEQCRSKRHCSALSLFLFFF